MSIPDVPTFASDGDLNVVIETPKGSRNKYGFDNDLETFVLKGSLTAGHSFPYDFGFIPRTLGGDGDPLDVLVLMDESAFPGCVIRCRLIGAIKAEQTKKGKTERNDRLLAVASKSAEYENVRSTRDLGNKVMDQIEHFFVSYNEAKGKKFRALGRMSGREAHSAVKKAIDAAAGNQRER
jgi:inorganic pyrophosphatase